MKAQPFFLILLIVAFSMLAPAGEKEDKSRKKADKKKPSPGKVMQGKIIFNNSGYFKPGSKSCASCHVTAGKNSLAGSADRLSEKELRKEINYCIKERIKGKERKETSTVMRALVAYLQSLKKDKDCKIRYIYICPDACEGEKSYKNPGGCPECKKKMRRIRID
ncbi:MAG: hypothetical protein E3J72_06750 [Planctomycetota bacterium]|nr:MAG: hypothetical protein E3J72_06750 [Planctomycetota bacterium]